jgi:hypothetical protein
VVSKTAGPIYWLSFTVFSGSLSAKYAKRSLELFLASKNVQARESLEEAGEELLALFELEVPNMLNILLLSTNVIENTFKNLRRHIGRGSRWRKATYQADLWLSSGLTLAERGYRRIRGVDNLPRLIEGLEREKMEGLKAA